MYFWPKIGQNGQNGQNENFPRHNTTVKWLKTIVSSFLASYMKFWCGVLKKKLKTLIFWPKMARNGEKGPKTAKREFFQKSAWNIFLSFIKIQLCAKNHKNLMRGFLDMVWHTHRRTHGRTHERESIGLLAKAERPKIKKIHSSVWKILVHSDEKCLR